MHQRLLRNGCNCFFSAWLFVLLISGDVLPNPGPAFTSSTSSSSSSSHDSFSFMNSMNLSQHLSFIYYNVQSIANKIDSLTAKLTDFDILLLLLFFFGFFFFFVVVVVVVSFLWVVETWLHLDIHTTDLLIPEFMPPERKDRDRLVALWNLSNTPCFIKEYVTLNHSIQNEFGSRFTLSIHMFYLIYSTAP